MNALGYCVGGTLLAVALAYMARRNDNRIASATFLTTQTDFADAGDLRVFIDEAQISALEESMAEKGYLDGTKMAKVFNMLRPNDLIWSFVVNNYVRGQVADAVRSPDLEFRRDADDARLPFLLSAQLLSRKQIKLRPAEDPRRAGLFVEYQNPRL